MKRPASLLAQNLRALREERNLSLARLSELTGVSKSMLRQIETGQSSPTITMLWKIANALHVTLDDRSYTVEEDHFISSCANRTHQYQNPGQEMAVTLVLISYLA